MPKTAADRIAAAQTAFDAGFTSKAGKKAATDELSRAFSAIRDTLSAAILSFRTEENEKQNGDDYWAVPFDLHNVRDRHFEIAARYDVAEFAVVRDLLALRAAIKDAEIVKVERPAIVEKVERARLSIAAEMERRKVKFAQDLDVSRMFATKDGYLTGVTVTAHYVTNEHGTTFLRTFFYLHGRIIALNALCAIAEIVEREAGEG